MAKRQKFQDIVSSSKDRSIRNVSKNREREEKAQQEDEEQEDVPEQKGEGAHRRQRQQGSRKQSTPKERPRPRLPRSAKIGIVFLTLLVLVVAGFAFYLLFSGATVTVTPKSEQVSVSNTVSAAKSADTADIAYETLSVSAEVATSVPASGTQDVSEKAAGTIVVYNDYSSDAQRLVPNTRFQGPNGNIYRARDGFSVPGQRNGTPGSVEIQVVAAEAGDDYNLSAGTELTIPGLQGTDLFDDMWAEAKSDIAGGFEGQRAQISDTDRERARQQLEQQLEKQLLQKANAQVPEQMYLFDGATQTSLNPLSQSTTTASSATITMRGQLGAALFNTADIAALVADATVPQYDGADVSITDMSALTFAPVQPDAYAPTNTSQFDFTLNGDVRVVWAFDRSQLASDLAGSRESELESILDTYPSIAEAQIVLRPFWRTTFPTSPDDITVNVQGVTAAPEDQ